METSKLKKFAQFARRSLIDQVSGKMQQVLAEDSAARREEPKAVEDLAMQIKTHGRDQVIETVAYTWFNRFCALRFMDVNRFTRIGVVSPAEGQFQPEILAEAKMGHIDEDMVPEKTRQQIFALLNGTTSSRDPQAEAYRLLVVAACNDYNKAMDYLFEYIADYTELLMPDDLLSGNSILAYTREAMTPDACQDVEVIGWLYQFYISEKKDEVFNGLKKNKKITPENIPAATQLFTPHWIVRYLVENSLGRLWMLNRPNSRLAEKMEYYIKPETPETDFLKIGKPEEIKVCDPAAGSGHMLTYSFDILYFIYEEEGYESTEIPRLILENNLFGIEIDKRAGELAAFALTMKARAKQRRFFSKKVAPNICVLENIHFENDELKDYMDFIGWDLFTAPLQTTLRQFEEADNFGSLIRPKVTDVNSMLKILEAKNVSGQLFLSKTHKKVLHTLQQANYLSPKYHVVIANPPYMGGKGMNWRLASWVKDNYPNSKSDLFAIFVERIMELIRKGGFIGLMTPFTWMFLSSYEKLRLRILKENTLTTLVRPEYHAFFESAFVPICGFTIYSMPIEKFNGSFIDLQSFYGADDQPNKALEAIKDNQCGWFYLASANDLLKVPGAPIVYWIGDNVRDLFSKETIASIAKSVKGLDTCDNDRFVRLWSEISLCKFNGIIKCRSMNQSATKWVPYCKGGGYRKWWGNLEFAVNWADDGFEICNFKNPDGSIKSRPQNVEYYFKEGITFSSITSSLFSCRKMQDSIFGGGGNGIFTENTSALLGFFNSKLNQFFMSLLNPTLNMLVGDINRLPYVPTNNHAEVVDKAINYSKIDWDSYETSWDFTEQPLLSGNWGVGCENQRQEQLFTSCFPLSKHIADAYTSKRVHWHEVSVEMQRLEQENNCMFIDAYGLKNELTPDVPVNEITLTCNPHYRYNVDACEAGSEQWKAMEARLLEDTMKEFISYSVGCMFGRYSLDMPSLVLANQGETVEDYARKLAEWKNQNEIASQTDITFHPDMDNVIPVLDGDWFTDEIVERFQSFLHITFGDEYYEANL
jgi:hypothetical protein